MTRINGFNVTPRLSTTVARLIQKSVHPHNPGKDNPYHNNEHMVGVCRVATSLYEETASSINEEFVTALTIAALMHDYGHSGKPGDDDRNIPIAIEAVESIEHVLKEPGVSDSTIILAKDLIEQTYYPRYKVSLGTGDSRILFECLLDADLIEAVCSGDTNVILKGLLKEINSVRDEDDQLTEMDMYDNQVDFVNTVNLYTARARDTWSEISTRFLTNLKEQAENN